MKDFGRVMNRSLFSKTISALTLLVFAFGCASSTLVKVNNDPSVKIYIDGEFRGAGEYLHSDAKIWGSETNIRLEKDGCAPVTYKFKRNEEWDTLPCVGGILLIPLFWAKKYHAEHVYDFACKKP